MKFRIHRNFHLSRSEPNLFNLLVQAPKTKRLSVKAFPVSTLPNVLTAVSFIPLEAALFKNFQTISNIAIVME